MTEIFDIHIMQLLLKRMLAQLFHLIHQLDSKQIFW
jgi:hypothetical protein